MSTTVPSRRLEGSLRATEVVKGLYVMDRSHDGVYEFFPGQPNRVVVDNQSYNLSPVPGVRMAFNTVVADEAMRIFRIEAPSRALGQAAAPLNVNDGIYRDVQNGPPAYAVVDGRTYSLSVMKPINPR